jgi:hypothetical protein
MSPSARAVIRQAKQTDHEWRTEELGNTVGKPTRQENVGHAAIFSTHCFYQLGERAAPAVHDEND